MYHHLSLTERKLRPPTQLSTSSSPSSSTWTREIRVIEREKGGGGKGRERRVDGERGERGVREEGIDGIDGGRE